MSEKTAQFSIPVARRSVLYITKNEMIKPMALFCEGQTIQYTSSNTHRYQMLSAEDLLAEHASIASVGSQHSDLSHHEKPGVKLTTCGKSNSSSYLSTIL